MQIKEKEMKLKHYIYGIFMMLVTVLAAFTGYALYSHLTHRVMSVDDFMHSLLIVFICIYFINRAADKGSITITIKDNDNE